MIFDRHVLDHLAPYIDGELDGQTRARVDAHLARCSRCRSTLSQIGQVQSMLQTIPTVEAPAAVWAGIETRLPAKARYGNRIWRYASAAGIALAALVTYFVYPVEPIPHWQVVALEGIPRAGTQSISATESIPNGQWIETDIKSRARIRIGSIGSVDVEPNTRIRLVSTADTGHRLALSNGKIRATIVAPPRLFFLDTPLGAAVDLGCEYEMYCDRLGNGSLKVTQGWVSLGWDGAESLVPAGASCLMRSGYHPGTPSFDDAAVAFVRALEAFDFDRISKAETLDIILQHARPRDTLTLWHLLARTKASERVRIYERMVALSPPPAALEKEKILSLDRESLERWKGELAWTW